MLIQLRAEFGSVNWTNDPGINYIVFEETPIREIIRQFPKYFLIS